MAASHMQLKQTVIPPKQVSMITAIITILNMFQYKQLT